MKTGNEMDFHKSKTTVLELLGDGAKVSALEMAEDMDMDPAKLDEILRILIYGGRIMQLPDPLSGPPLFEIVAGAGEPAASGIGDVCDYCSAGVIGMDGHCHWCGDATTSSSDPDRVDCGCGGTLCKDGTCGEELARSGSLTEADWREIYCSLCSSWRRITDDEVDDPEMAETWRRHLRTIMAKIGNEGQGMVLAKSAT